MRTHDLPRRLCFLLAFLSLGSASPASSQGIVTPKQEPPTAGKQDPAPGEEGPPEAVDRPSLRAGLLTGEIALDGVLSEPAWAGADTIANLTTIEPEEGGVPAGQTTVKVLVSSSEIVVGVVCHDADPSGIVSFSKARDSDLEEQDHVLIVLDTFQDGRSGYVFAVNPSAARFDGLVIAQGADVNSNWDAVWEARTARDDQGWSAEIRIPIKSISFAKGLTTWGFNVQRRVQRLQETSRWAGATRDYEIYQTSRAGILTDLTGFDLGLGLSLRPALVGEMSKPGPDEDRMYDGVPSLDATKTLGSNTLASLTVNTDFAETESDARRTNLTRFDLFFPEKRTFFLQGADTFDFGLGLDTGSAEPDAQVNLVPFFTRRIGLVLDEEGDLAEVPIDVGGKVNGRLGETNFGAVAVRTRKLGELGVPASTMGVVRLKQNVLDQSSVGMIATVGDPRGRPGSWMAGVDLTYQTTDFRDEKNLLFGAWALRNGRDDLEGDKWAYGGKLDYPNDLWDASLNFLHIGDGFDPSLGFVPRTGNILEAGAEFRPRPGGETVRQLFFGVKSFLVNKESRWESYLVTAKPLDIRFESGDGIEVNIEPQGERLTEDFDVEDDVVVPAGAYKWWRYSVIGSLADKRKISGEAKLSRGDFYDGSLDTVEASVIVKPSATFTGELALERNSVDLPGGSFTQNLYSARLEINVSSDLQVSSLLQYDNQSRSFGSNTRLRWTFHPLGDVFFVYNHNMGRSVTDRWLFDSNQLLLKVQYAFRR